MDFGAKWVTFVRKCVSATGYEWVKLIKNYLKPKNSEFQISETIFRHEHIGFFERITVSFNAFSTFQSRPSGIFIINCAKFLLWIGSKQCSSQSTHVLLSHMRTLWFVFEMFAISNRSWKASLFTLINEPFRSHSLSYIVQIGCDNRLIKWIVRFSRQTVFCQQHFSSKIHNSFQLKNYPECRTCFVSNYSLQQRLVFFLFQMFWSKMIQFLQEKKSHHYLFKIFLTFSKTLKKNALNFESQSINSPFYYFQLKQNRKVSY